MTRNVERLHFSEGRGEYATQEVPWKPLKCNYWTSSNISKWYSTKF